MTFCKYVWLNQTESRLFPPPAFMNTMGNIVPKQNLALLSKYSSCLPWDCRMRLECSCHSHCKAHVKYSVLWISKKRLLASGTIVTADDINFQKYKEIFLIPFLTLEINREQNESRYKFRIKGNMRNVLLCHYLLYSLIYPIVYSQTSIHSYNLSFFCS